MYIYRLQAHLGGHLGLRKARGASAFSCTNISQLRVLQEAQAPEETDEYRQTVEKLSNILAERRGKYDFADIRVSLQSEQHGALGAEAVVVAYRYSYSLFCVPCHYPFVDAACAYNIPCCLGFECQLQGGYVW